MILTWIVSVLLPFLFAGGSSAACQKPPGSSSLYIFSTERSSYDTGDIYEVTCIPGYEPETLYQLVCQSSTKWLGTIPNCSKADQGTRWWILLIAIVSFIIIVPCTIPRIYYCFKDEREVRRMELLHKRQVDKGYLDSTLVDDAGIDDQSNLFMEQNNVKLLRMEGASEFNYYSNVTPQPLPKKRPKTSQHEASSNGEGDTAIFKTSQSANLDS